MNRALEGSILKLDIQGAFFLTFLSKIVATFVTSFQTFHPVLVYCHLWKWFQTADRAVQRRNK